jgi:hypothetical protein
MQRSNGNHHLQPSAATISCNHQLQPSAATISCNHQLKQSAANHQLQQPIAETFF